METGATFTSPGPTYGIVASAATGSGLGNYSITYVNGTLTVNARALTVTANTLLKPALTADCASPVAWPRSLVNSIVGSRFAERHVESILSSMESR